MENHWQEIWNNRKVNVDELSSEDETRMILELKRIVGWDFYGKKSSVSVEEFKKEYNYLKENLGLTDKTSASVFEVGCGSGTNLYFFQKDGFEIGGSDYAENLLDIAKKVIGVENFIECITGEASELPTAIKYDTVFSAGVFSYFSDLNYTEKVLEKMVVKARRSVGVLKILDEATKEECLKYRRENTKNYDERYKGLPKLFHSKKFFEDFALKNGLEIKFNKKHVEGYWNEAFNFDCFLYKKFSR